MIYVMYKFGCFWGRTQKTPKIKKKRLMLLGTESKNITLMTYAKYKNKLEGIIKNETIILFIQKW